MSNMSPTRAHADDYDLALIFVDELIPHAVDWYTGDARD